DPEDAVAIFDVVARSLQLLRREFLAALDGAFGGNANRRATDGEGACTGTAQSQAALLRGEFLAARDGACAGNATRRATDEEGARTGTAESRAAIGVALHDPDLLDRDAA